MVALLSMDVQADQQRDDDPNHASELHQGSLEEMHPEVNEDPESPGVDDRVEKSSGPLCSNHVS